MYLGCRIMQQKQKGKVTAARTIYNFEQCPENGLESTASDCSNGSWPCAPVTQSPTSESVRYRDSGGQRRYRWLQNSDQLLCTYNAVVVNHGMQLEILSETVSGYAVELLNTVLDVKDLKYTLTPSDDLRCYFSPEKILVCDNIMKPAL